MSLVRARCAFKIGEAMTPFQPPVPPQVVAVPMDDYLNYTRTDWSAAKLTARAKRRWVQMRGEFTNKDNPSYIRLTEAEYQAWKDGTR